MIKENMKDLYKQVENLQSFLKEKENEIDYNIIYETYGVDIKQLEQDMMNYVFVLNSPGTVDSGYLGEVKVIIFNTNSDQVTIKKGMKIAQAVLCPVINGKYVDLELKKDLGQKDRGDNGFGSTGI
jgi:dUTPase